jgi:hypothetical protein
MPNRHRRIGLNVAVTLSSASANVPKARAPALSLTMMPPDSVRPSTGSEKWNVSTWLMSTIACGLVRR